LVIAPADILKKYWGYSQFRHPQEEIIEAVLQGRDALAILPTGAGKSVCFQVPTLLQEGLCLVITPLIALMQDQVAQLRQKGIPAVALHAGLSRAEIDLLLDNCVYGPIKFLYVSPERTQTEIFKERFQKMKVNLIAIDEAHCISQWGHDFRPAYRTLAALRDRQQGVPLLAVTASATSLVKTDIATSLQLNEPVVFQRSFARENLSLVVRESENKEKKLLEILRKVPGCAIVYVRSRKATVEWSRKLQKQGVATAYYHGGMSYTERNQSQQQWISNQARVMVATNAFGMGINKADVRVVVHLDLPENPESYYQEAGRAGRDGKRAYAALLFHLSDAADLRTKTEHAVPDVAYLRNVYQALANYFQLAEGAGQGVSFSISLEAFCNQFGFRMTPVLSAIRKLEEEGLLEVSDQFYQPARLHVVADKKRLYEFQVAQARFDPMIKALLRLYGGELFTSFVAISEAQLAQATQLSHAEVQEYLHQLNNLQLLAYEPASDAPRLTFLTPRQDAARLPIDRKKLETRAALLKQKAEAMIAYATESRCRMQQLQEYFGETNTQPCGGCDVCVAKRKKTDLNLHEDYREQILQLLAQKSCTVDELETEIGPKEPEWFGEVVRDLIEEGRVAYDAYWVLHLKK
jgi:ATP-dependent DNA helicase RecQ